MANLDQIQRMLNTNEDYRRHFLQDPVGALAQEGLQLSFDMQHHVRQMVSQAQVGPEAIPGAAAGGFGPPTLGKVGPGPTLGKMGPGPTLGKVGPGPMLGKMGPGPTLGKVGPGPMRQIPITIFIKI